MNFDFSDDQKLLREQARRALGEHRSAARKALEADGALDAGLWRLAADMGWLGAAIPEAYGGAGLGRLELCVLAEELGRALAPIPFSSTVYGLAEALLAHGSEAQKQAWLPKIVAGEAIGCLALSERPGPLTSASIEARVEGGKLSGRKLPVLDGPSAHAAVVAAREGGEIGLFLAPLDQPGVRRTPLKTLDPSRAHAEIVFTDAAVERLGERGAGWAALEALMDRMAVLLAFEQVGGAQACLDMAVDYARNRYAFSRPIGSFQAVKHKLADMYVALELARSNTLYGAWALEAGAAELPLAAAAARVAASEAFTLAAKENVQTHGGIGFTWDVDCHLFYRRAKLLAVQLGAPVVWKEKLVARLERRNAA